MIRKALISCTASFHLMLIGLGTAGLSYSAETVGNAAVGAEKIYSLAEVAGHSQREDCWMAIGGEVYNLSAYLPQHPSNPAIVLPWCGKEATQAYRTKNRGRPHTSNADQLLSKYRIGKLGDAR